MDGFYYLDTDSYSDSLKCYVNLSDNCFETINSDMRFFSLYKESISFSGFLNTIIKNFYMTSKASIQSLLDRKKEELNLLLDRKYKTDNKEVLENIKNDLIDKYYKELIKDNSRYSKGSGHYFRINLDVANLLNDNVENQDIDDAGGSLGCYFKIILEEYAELPQSERERVYYKEVVDVIEDAISHGKGIKIIQRPFERFDKSNTEKLSSITRINKYYVKPYKIVCDSSFQYIYLVGLSQMINDESSEDEPKFEPHAFRISLIQRATKLISMNGFISKDVKSEIERRLSINGPSMLIDPDDPLKMLSVKVRFSNHGLETLKRISYGRPKSFEKLDENTYVFKADFYSARNYFWRFANNVEILEPESLRESVKKLLALSCKVYDIKID